MKKILLSLTVMSLLGLSVACNRGDQQQETEMGTGTTTERMDTETEAGTGTGLNEESRDSATDPAAFPQEQESGEIDSAGEMDSAEPSASEGM